MCSRAVLLFLALFQAHFIGYMDLGFPKSFPKWNNKESRFICLIEYFEMGVLQ